MDCTSQPKRKQLAPLLRKSQGPQHNGYNKYHTNR